MFALALKRIFFFIPKVVHWVVTLSPFAIVYAFYQLFGIEFATVCVVGAALFLNKTMMSPSNEFTNALSSQVLTRKGKKVTGKRVAVIGAGPAGLCTSKECIENGHSVTTYDSYQSLGGEFGNRFWPGGKLTSSPYVTCFSDYEPKQRSDGKPNWLHKTKEEYVEYLREYAVHYKVKETLRMGEKVVKISMKTLPGEKATYNITTNKWLPDGKKVEQTDGPYDHIAFCIGGNREPFIPDIPGAEGFKKAGGEYHHSAEFGAAKSVEEAFNWADGKRVVGLGMGESMADIYGIMLEEHPRPPKDCYVAIRGGSWIIPRVNPLNGKVNDWDSTRLRYSMPKWAHNMAVSFCGFLACFFDTTGDKEQALRYKLMTTIPGMKPCYKPATKSNRFISVIAKEKAKLVHAGIEKFEGKNVHFTNGKIVEDVDSIVFGTGFRPFELFSESITFEGQAPPEICPCQRFLRTFDPKFGSGIGFIGIGIRPLVGSIPTVAEIQARLFVAVVSNERVLPPTHIMEARAASDAELAYREFGAENGNARSVTSWKGITNWIPFMDSIAREVGCAPKPIWMLTKPFLALKLMFGPMTVMHYRLTGLGAKPKMAEDVIRRLPIGSRFSDMAFYTGIHSSIALFRWPVLFLKPITYRLIDTSQSSLPKIRMNSKKVM